MLPWKRTILLGIASWLALLLLALALFPVKRVNPPLFETLMSLAAGVAAAILLPLCFRGRPLKLAAAAAAGTLWVAINLILDYPMFASGPMKMTAGQYYSQIGLDYLIFPVFACGWARMMRTGVRE